MCVVSTVGLILKMALEGNRAGYSISAQDFFSDMGLNLAGDAHHKNGQDEMTRVFPSSPLKATISATGRSSTNMKGHVSENESPIRTPLGLDSFTLLNTDIAKYSVATAIINDIVALLILRVLLDLPTVRSFQSISMSMSILLTGGKLVLVGALVIGFNRLE